MAKCSNCSAPLSKNSNICEYCGTKNDVDLKGIHEYTVTKPESERICPHCNIPMQTINILSDDTFYIEQCNSCKGLFFDNGELEALIDKSVDNVYNINMDALNILQEESFVQERPIKYIECPVCKKMMNRNKFGFKSGVVIDSCKDHGIWLDAGELSQLLKWRKAGGKILHEQQEYIKEQKRLEEERIKKRKKTYTGLSKNYLDDEIYGGLGWLRVFSLLLRLFSGF